MLQPAFGRARQRMAADERESRRQRPGRGDDGAFGAAGVGDHGGPMHVLVELREKRDVLADRRRKYDEIRFGEHDEIVGGDIDRVQPHRGLENVFAVDRDDERRRPQLPRRKCDRPADEAQSDDADLFEDDRLRRERPSRLDDGKVGRLRAFQDPAGIEACLAVHPRNACSVAKQNTGRRELARPRHKRQCILRSKRG